VGKRSEKRKGKRKGRIKQRVLEKGSPKGLPAPGSEAWEKNSEEGGDAAGKLCEGEKPRGIKKKERQWKKLRGPPTEGKKKTGGKGKANRGQEKRVVCGDVNSKSRTAETKNE